MNVKKVNTDFYVKVDTDYDVFGVEASFHCYYVNDTTNEIFNVGNPFSEIVSNIINPRVGVVNGDVLKNGNEIILTSGFNLKLGDVFKDVNNNMYYITYSDINKIVIKNKLNSDILSGSILTQVGNTGIYKVLMNITSAGNYTIFVNNPSIGLQNLAYSVEIVNEDLNDMQSKLNSLLVGSGVENYRKYKGFV